MGPEGMCVWGGRLVTVLTRSKHEKESFFIKRLIGQHSAWSELPREAFQPALQPQMPATPEQSWERDGAVDARNARAELGERRGRQARLGFIARLGAGLNP